MKQIVMKTMTKREILQYVVNHYKTNRRAIDMNSGKCYYRSPEGLRCAHSICLTDEGLHQIELEVGLYDNLADAQKNIDLLGDNIHKPEFRGHSVKFWTQVQMFHDDCSYWIETTEGNELSRRGQEHLQRLLTIYNNEYTDEYEKTI